MGWLSEWVNEAVIKDGYPFTFVGIAGAILRSIKAKSNWRGYVTAIVAGAILSATITFLIGPSSIPQFVLGTLCFAAGFSWQKIVAIIDKGGTKTAEKMFNPQEPKEDEDE